MAVITLGFCAASGAMVWELRQNTYAQAVSAETNLLNAFAQDIARNIEIYDKSLQGVVQGLQEPGLPGLSPHLQDMLLYDQSTSARDLGAILVLDATGRVTRGSTPEAIGAELGDREYFLAQKTAPDRGLFISAPFARRVTGHDEVIALSRSIRAADGSFAGVVVGTMRLAYFREMFSRSDMGPHGSVNLFGLDGTTLMRVPYDHRQIGANLASSDNFQRFLKSPSGTFTGQSVIDGVDRIYSFEHVGDLPLVLNVALGEDDVFAVWRTKAIIILLALSALCATGVMLGYRLRRQLRLTATAEAMLSRSEAQYRLLADNAQDVIVRLDRSLRRTYVSPAVIPMLGYTPGELMDSKLGDIAHPDDWPSVIRLICASQTEGSNTEATYRLKTKTEDYLWVEGRYSWVADDGGFIVVLRDVSKRKRAEEQLEALNAELARVALTDALTGLSNRRAFDEALEREWRRAARDRNAISLLLLDVDRFKAYNDRYGHQDGDACLRAVAEAVQGTIRRPGDLAARYGGEEFVVVLPDTDEAGAAQVAERVRHAVETLALPHLDNAACGSVVTVSLGCSTCMPAEGDDGTALLVAAADARLYEAKRLGRNRVCAETSTSSQAPLPSDEIGRLNALNDYDKTISIEGSDSLDRIARLTAQLFDMPRAFVSLVGADEAILVGRHNVEMRSVPRDAAYCAHTILGEEPLVIPNTRTDPRFTDNPLTNAGVGFYAGAPLLSSNGAHRLGALCMVDDRARPALDEGQRHLLVGLARLVTDDLERRRMIAISVDRHKASVSVA